MERLKLFLDVILTICVIWLIITIMSFQCKSHDADDDHKNYDLSKSEPVFRSPKFTFDTDPLVDALAAVAYAERFVQLRVYNNPLVRRKLDFSYLDEKQNG
jgi:hypothetical protein